MLSKLIYNLCHLLLTPYENLNLINNDFDYLDNRVLEEIYLRKLFNYKLRKQSNSIFENYHLDYSYKILDKNLNYIKLLLNFKISFKIKDSTNIISSAGIHNYIIILEHTNNKFRLIFIAEDEENPTLYNYVMNTDFSSIYSLIFSKKQKLHEYEIPVTDLSNKPPNNSSLFLNNAIYKRISSAFNVDAACSYAETYALTPNPKYKSFDGIGGDCTNFISQILHFGGLKQTSTWKPYTNAWIRVEDIYWYLTSNKLAAKLPDDTYLDRGCLIQFYTPAIGKFFHNGFITYKLQNNDCLYCCHSYNKLNYPLSQIYPNRYPKLRGLKFT